MNIETKHILGLIFILAAGGAGLFLTLVFQRLRDVALFLFLACAVVIEKMNINFVGQFWYRGTSRGIEVSLIDVIPLCLLIATLLLPRYRRGRFYWPASFGLMLVYFAYCGVSVMYEPRQLYGVWELVKMLRGLMVFLAAALFIRTRRELAVVVTALGLVVCFEAANALEQRLFKGAVRPPGTFDHENSLSTYLCMVGPVLLAAAMSNWSKWLRWFAGLSCIFATGAELMTLSRMGVPAFTLVMTCTALACMSWRPTIQKAASTVVVLLVVGILLAFSWDGLKARYTQSNIEAELFNKHEVETRGVYWRLAFAMLEDHPYGVGLNDWPWAVGKKYGPELHYPYTDYDDIQWTPTAHEARTTFLAPAADTLPALTLGELGYLGTALFLLMWLRWFQMGAVFLRGRLDADPMHRMGIGLLFGACGIFLQSMTEWTYRQTSIMFTCHVLMGALAALYYARRRARREAAKALEESDAGIPEPLPVRIAPVVE